MGRVLQRTSISTNIKERLDFSCAVFGPDGGLVSNAPHIPVHLGAMQETVQYQVGTVHLDMLPKHFRRENSVCLFFKFIFTEQIKTLGNKLKEGDVILSNHPCAGGSHLPDLTVITPVSPSGLFVFVLPSLLLLFPHLPHLYPFLPPKVFQKGVRGPVFFVASRGHHADIGGITPGSMPPNSTSLQQEGAVFTSFKLVTGGVFQEAGES